MNQKKVTKDELFLLKLYQLAVGRGDPTTEIDRYSVGKLIGQNDRGVDTIVNNLAQINFLKKGEGSAVYLTSQGLKFLEEHT
jgi:hypothetical protein